MPPADISQWVPEIMALFRVQALYDFVGESNSAELSITAVASWRSIMGKF
jgi:hypothetical protein